MAEPAAAAAAAMEYAVPEDGNEEMCGACRGVGILLCCEACPAAYHAQCAGYGVPHVLVIASTHAPRTFHCLAARLCTFRAASCEESMYFVVGPAAAATASVVRARGLASAVLSAVTLRPIEGPQQGPRSLQTLSLRRVCQEALHAAALPAAFPRRHACRPTLRLHKQCNQRRKFPQSRSCRNKRLEPGSTGLVLQALAEISLLPPPPSSALIHRQHPPSQIHSRRPSMMRRTSRMTQGRPAIFTFALQ